MCVDEASGRQRTSCRGHLSLLLWGWLRLSGLGSGAFSCWVAHILKSSSSVYWSVWTHLACLKFSCCRTKILPNLLFSPQHTTFVTQGASLALEEEG